MNALEGILHFLCSVVVRPSTRVRGIARERSQWGEEMLLTDWFPIYVARRINLRPKTIGIYKIAIGKFDRWHLEKHGTPADTKLLCVSLVADWLSDLSNKEKLKPRSVNSYRSSINAIWTGAMIAGESPESNGRLVPSARVSRTIPIAWTLDDLAKLLEAAKTKRGRRKNRWGTIRRDFWVGMYLFLYDTGARFGAALSVQAVDVNIRKRTVLLRAENDKTDADQLVSISDETADVLQRLIDDGHELVWPNGVNRQQLYDEHKRTLQSIGLPFDRYHMFHCFRKTTATQLTIAKSAEEASAALGQPWPFRRT